MNMRELEDEGKVMALANFAYPIPDAENPHDGRHRRRRGSISSRPTTPRRCSGSSSGILWRYPSEQFAYMAQRVLEKSAVALAEEALKRTGLKRMAVAGGVFSNIKMNMRLVESARPGAPLRLPPHGGRRARHRGGARGQPDAVTA